MKCRQCRQSVATPLATRGVARPYKGRHHDTTQRRGQNQTKLATP